MVNLNSTNRPTTPVTHSQTPNYEYASDEGSPLSEIMPSSHESKKYRRTRSRSISTKLRSRSTSEAHSRTKDSSQSPARQQTPLNSQSYPRDSASNHSDGSQDSQDRRYYTASASPDHHDQLQLQLQLQHSQFSHRHSTEQSKLPYSLHYKQIMTLKCHAQAVSAVKFSPDGKTLATCSVDGIINIWDSYTGVIKQAFKGHLAGVCAVAWSPDSRWIVSGSDDKSIRLWDTWTGKAHSKVFKGHDNYVTAIAVSPKGNMMASGSHDESIFLWDMRNGNILHQLPAHSDPVRSLDFVHDGTLIASCSSDRLIRLWDTQSGSCLGTIVHDDNPPVVGVRFSPNGKYVLAWTLDSSIRLWSYLDGSCVKTYQGHTNSKVSLIGEFGHYGSTEYPGAFVVSGSEDGNLYIWDVRSKKLLQTIEDAHEGIVFAADSHPNDCLIATGGQDKLVRIWRHEEPKFTLSSDNISDPEMVMNEKE